MTLRFHAQAREELRQAAIHYASLGRRLGEEFIERLEQALASVQRFPRARREIDAFGTRQVTLRQFPYVMVYTLEEIEGEPSITIYAVAHSKRRPGYWRDRLPSEHQE